MKHSGKATPAVRRRIFELADGKKSQRQIVAVLETEGVTLSQPAIGTILRGERPKPEPEKAAVGAGTGKAQGGQPEPEQGGDGDGTGASVWEDLPALPEDADVATRALWMKVREARERIRSMPKNADTSSEYAAVSRIELAALEKLKAALPKPKADPAKDPHNLAALAMIRQHVIATIESVKRRAREHGYRFPGDEAEG